VLRHMLRHALAGKRNEHPDGAAPKGFGVRSAQICSDTRIWRRRKFILMSCPNLVLAYAVLSMGEMTMQMLTRRPPGGSALAGLLLRKIPISASQAETVTHVMQKPGIGVRSPLDMGS
jgi:hypothetical protein